MIPLNKMYFSELLTNYEHTFSAMMSTGFDKLEEILLTNDLAPSHIDKTVLLRC